jgi:GNAT superfamily N-acetyltransferase
MVSNHAKLSTACSEMWMNVVVGLRQDGGMWSIRDYQAADATGWLRCRVLAFLDTAYFDDVVTRKPVIVAGLELVAVSDGIIGGVLDASADGHEATIETIAVHPEFRRSGVGRGLLGEISQRVAARVATQVDAWTRDEEATRRVPSHVDRAGGGVARGVRAGSCVPADGQVTGGRFR